jgi:hypothetical protein
MSYSTQNTVPSVAIVINWIARNFAFYVALAVAGAGLYLVAATIYFWPIAATILLIFTSVAAGAACYGVFYSTKYTLQHIKEQVVLLKQENQQIKQETQQQISATLQYANSIDTETQQFAAETARCLGELQTEIQRLRGQSKTENGQPLGGGSVRSRR